VKLGIASTEDLVAALVLDTGAATAFAADAKPITDDDNRLATTMVYGTRHGLDAQKAGNLLASYDVLQDPKSFVYREFPDLDFGYIGAYLEGLAKADPSVSNRINGIARCLGSGDQAVYLAVLSASLSETKNHSQNRLVEAIARYPDSGLLRFKAIEPWFSGVVAGTAPADIMDVATALPAEAASVVVAARHAVQGEWEALAAMDEILAEIHPTRAWALFAAQSRVEWRLRVQNAELIKGFSEEALDIIDERIVRFPNLFMLVLRAWTSYRAENPDAAMGSISALTRQVADTGLQLSTGERAGLKNNLETLISLVDAIADKGQADLKRANEIRSKLTNAIRIL
jgi:hypothetical protein